MSQLPPPGWYPDADSRYQRWWDGQRWTDALQAVPPSAPVVVAPRNGFATTGLVGGIVAAAVTVFALVGGVGLDPLTVLLALICAGVGIAWGIPGLVRANRLQPPVGKARAIVGLSLGGATIVLVVLVAGVVIASYAPIA
jgi:hypothetical protein